jgi:exopolysaccharide biosynthesis polyprenyl glycosylphosphotransferase
MTLQGVTNTKSVELAPDPSEFGSEVSLFLAPGMASRGARLRLGASPRRLIALLVSIGTDTTALLVGLALVSYSANGWSGMTEMVAIVPLFVVAWFLICVAWDLYAWKGRGRQNIGRLLGASLSGAGLLLLWSSAYPQSGFSVSEISLGSTFVVVVAGGLRLLYEHGVRVGSRKKGTAVSTLIIGGDEERGQVRQALEKHPGAYACVGELNTSLGAVNLPLLRRVLDRTGAQNVVVAGTESLCDARFPDLLRSLRLRRVNVKLVFGGASSLEISKPTISHDMGFPFLEVGSPRLDSMPWAFKRILDIGGSFAGLILLSPLLVTVAMLIKLTSPGPVFFRQKRVGADEKVFTCYKFRSMYQDAERRQAELEARNEAGSVIFKVKNDPRITPVGRFIRRWSIDELPQLINVFTGEMSLIGPRPLPVRDFELMSEQDKQRLGTVPGITGFWQISGRSDLSFEEMLRLDLYYIENWSLLLDARILLKTLMVVLRHDGAY